MLLELQKHHLLLLKQKRQMFHHQDQILRSFHYLFLSKPYDSEAAVGSLMILKTSNPAILPASFVA
jgi:hypothetical protein